MKKVSLKKILVGLGLLALIGCGAVGDNTKEDKVKLTKEEITQLKNNKKDMLKVLLSKASYKEAINSGKTNKDQKEKIKSLETKAVNDYYILSEASKKVEVTKEEIKAVYEKNKKELKGKKLEEVKNAIEKLIRRTKLNQEITKEIERIKAENKIGEGLSKEEIKSNAKKLDSQLSSAIYKEAGEKLKSKKDKEAIKVLKRRVVNDYYILAEASKKVKVTKEEIKAVYEKNKKDLKGKKLEEVSKAIEKLIFENKAKVEVTKLLKEINKKYNLDELIKNYTTEDSKK